MLGPTQRDPSFETAVDRIKYQLSAMPLAFADVQVAAAQGLSRRDYKRTLHVDRRSVKIEKFSGEADLVIRLPLPTGVRSCMRSPCILRQEGERLMRLRMAALIALNAFAATDASAQAVGTQSWLPNLSGVYRCVNHCTGAGIVRVVQRGRQLTLVDPGGQLSSAWIEAPGHIWTAWKEGAVYSPDGFTIQFAGGTVWVLLEPTPIPGSVE